MSNETDRELLSLAAKAAGLHVAWDEEYECFQMVYKPGYAFEEWNPFDDDGDAMRLAVKLGFIIGLYSHYSTVDVLSRDTHIENFTVWHSSVGDNPYAATRRAIVQAAAAVGKGGEG